MPPPRNTGYQMINVPSWFDLPMACLGALVSAVLVAAVNIDHGILAALTAALKQAIYAFLATGLILRFSQRLALRPVARWFALTSAVVLPLLITFILLLAVHSLKGTAEPLYSTVPGTGLSLLGLLLVTWRSARTPSGSGGYPDPAPKPVQGDS